MSRIIIPQLEIVPNGATPQWRQAAFDRWQLQLRLANPDCFTEDGELIPWWRRLFGLWSR